jgi:hypothetical protein
VRKIHWAAPETSQQQIISFLENKKTYTAVYFFGGIFGFSWPS